MLRSCISVLSLTALAGTLALAAPLTGAAQSDNTPTKGQKPTAPSAADQMVPPGMTQEQMEAMAAAATPGPMHRHLARAVGTWNGKVSMYMPGAPDAMTSECVTVIRPMMDGRFTKSETTGEMGGGMGTFTGFGLYGYDNVGKKFQSTWVDNWGTGMMTGTGELASDDKTINWTFNFNCPITKGPTVMRQVDRWIDDNTMSLTMFGPDPTTGKEMKMMEIAYTRASPAPGTGASTTAPATPSRPNATPPRTPGAPATPAAPGGRGSGSGAPSTR